MKKINKKGFTLIELLAVIVIIAIIALIGIPSVTKIMSNSRKDAIKSTGLAMVKAAKTFVAAENITPPAGSFDDTTDTVTGGCYITWQELGMDSTKLSTGDTVATTATVPALDSDGSKVYVFEESGNYVYVVDLFDESNHGFASQTDDQLTEGGEPLRNEVLLNTAVTVTAESAAVPLCTT